MEERKKKKETERVRGKKTKGPSQLVLAFLGRTIKGRRSFGCFLEGNRDRREQQSNIANMVSWRVSPRAVSR